MRNNKYELQTLQGRRKESEEILREERWERRENNIAGETEAVFLDLTATNHTREIAMLRMYLMLQHGATKTLPLTFITLLEHCE